MTGRKWDRVEGRCFGSGQEGQRERAAGPGLRSTVRCQWCRRLLISRSGTLRPHKMVEPLNYAATNGWARLQERVE